MCKLPGIHYSTTLPNQRKNKEDILEKFEERTTWQKIFLPYVARKNILQLFFTTRMSEISRIIKPITYFEERVTDSKLDLNTFRDLFLKIFEKTNEFKTAYKNAFKPFPSSLRLLDNQLCAVCRLMKEFCEDKDNFHKQVTLSALNNLAMLIKKTHYSSFILLEKSFHRINNIQKSTAKLPAESLRIKKK